MKRQDEKLKEAFEKIKSEFSEHLEAINGNTNEIQSNYEHLCLLERKMDKLSERVDQLCMSLQNFLNETDMPTDTSETQYEIEELNDYEKELFLRIYCQQGPITYDELAEMMETSPALVQNYVKNLIVKGIPIVKRYISKKIYISLEQRFRSLQTRYNILNIEPTIMQKVRGHAQ